MPMSGAGNPAAIQPALKKRKTSGINGNLAKDASQTVTDSSFLDELDLMIAEDESRTSQGRLADMAPGSKLIQHDPKHILIHSRES